MKVNRLVIKDLGDNDLVHKDYEKHCSVVIDLGDDGIVHVDYENRHLVTTDLGDCPINSPLD